MRLERKILQPRPELLRNKTNPKWPLIYESSGISGLIFVSLDHKSSKLMKTTRLLLACCVFLLIYSCKKEDTSAKQPSGNTVVYNVHVSVMLQLVNSVRATGCTCGSTPMPAVPALTWNDVLAKTA